MSHKDDLARNALDACCNWSWKVRARVDGKLGEWSATRSFNTVQTLPLGAPTSRLPFTASFLEGFDEQPAYTGDCMSPPAGSACIGFKDGYIWLVFDLVQSKRFTATPSLGKTIETVLGGENEFHHILNTSLVTRVLR